MFRKGHRLFSAASIGVILVALLHAITHFSGLPEDLVMSALMTAMQAYRFDLGLGNPSMMDIHESLSLTMAISLLWVGLSNLLIARYTGLRDKLMRRVCSLNVFGVGALVALFAYYQLPAPAIGLGIVEILFVIARFRLRRSRIVR
ncbi:MAG: hypothetical protein ABI790_08555, partial [Betaproteobacteria bacterium]